MEARASVVWRDGGGLFAVEVLGVCWAVFSYLGFGPSLVLLLGWASPFGSGPATSY